MLRTHNNTDGNKLVIFSGIALYYGDTYILISSGNFLKEHLRIREILQMRILEQVPIMKFFFS